MRPQGHAPLTPLYACTLPPRVLGPAEDCGWVAEVSSESKGGGPACGRELGDPLRSLERLSSHLAVISVIVCWPLFLSSFILDF